MRVVRETIAVLSALVGLSAASAALAQDFDQPFFGGGYAPAPSYPYGGYGQTGGVGVGVGVGGLGLGVGAVRYDQGYYYGGYQYPAAGYGGGQYRRPAYSAADVYVAAPPPRPVYRAYYAPVYYGPAYGWRYVAYAPRPVARMRCQCPLY